MNVLKTKDLTKIYGSGTTEVIALNHANISVDQENLLLSLELQEVVNQLSCTCLEDWTARLAEKC